MDFGDVIAQCPEQLGHEDFRAGCHAAIARRIELDEPHLVCRVANREARHDALVLGRDNRPGASGWSVS